MIEKLNVSVSFTGDELYATIKLYDILRDMDFELSETLGMHFWIDEDAVFMSAPSYATGGGCDMDNAIAVEDWENFDELSAHELSHLFGFVFKMCILKRDYVRIGYYSKVFGGAE